MDNQHIIPATAGLYTADVTHSPKTGLFISLSPLIAWHWCDSEQRYKPVDMTGRADLTLPSVIRDADGPSLVSANGIWDAVSNIYTFGGLSCSEDYHGKEELETNMQYTLELELEDMA